MSTRPSLTTWLLIGVMAACSSAPTSPAPTDWTWRTALRDDELAAFPSASDLMQGIDAACTNALLMRGDAVLFGLQLLREGDHRSWLVRITSLEDEGDAADGLSLRVEVFDEQARPIASEAASVTKYLIGGATRACSADSVAPAVPDADRSPRLGAGHPSDKSRALFAVMDVLRIVEETDALADILWQAVRRPSVLCLLGGMRISAGMSFAHARPTTDPATGLAGYEVPLRINVNNVPGLLCTVTVVDPAPPLRVCGGVVRLIAHDPENPTRRVVLRLLAARRAQ